MAYGNAIGNPELYRLVFYVTEDGVKGYSYYTIYLHTSSNKTLAGQFPDQSLKPLSDKHGADEAAVNNFKSNEPGSLNENFTHQFFRVKDTVFEILPGLQEFTAADKIWNYPVLETLRFGQTQAIDTSNWKTYTNTNDGFEIGYPKEWNVRIVSYEIILENSKTKASFSIIEDPNPKKISLDEWFKEATHAGERPTIKASAQPVLINGVKAYKIYTENPPPNEFFEIVGIANQENRIFSLYATSGIKQDEPVLEQILSTFKFTK